MNFEPQIEASSRGGEAWRDIPELGASADIKPHNYGATPAGVGLGAGGSITAYPQHGIILTIVGFAISVSGFTLSVAFLEIWPVGILVVGLSVLWVSTIIARRAETRSFGGMNAHAWHEVEWTPTKLEPLHPVMGHTSPTV